MEAVGALYDEHQAHIFRYVWSRVGDRRLAEDLTGDVFVRMVTGLPGYRLQGLPFRAWLYQIARNRLVDHYRREGRHAATELGAAEVPAPREAEPASQVERKLAAEQLHHALSRLEPLQREVVSLRFVSGLSVQEVALALHATENAVKALQRRGLAGLRETLAQEGGE